MARIAPVFNPVGLREKPANFAFQPCDGCDASAPLRLCVKLRCRGSTTKKPAPSAGSGAGGFPALFLLRQWPHHHGEIATLQTIGHPLELGNVLEIRSNPAEQLEAILGTAHLAHPKHDGDLDMLALIEELARPPCLGVEIVDVDVGSVLDLFDLDMVLLLLGLARLLLLLEAEAPVVHDLADDGARVGGDFNEVQTLVAGHPQSLVDGDNADLFTISADEADRREPDSFIDAHLGCFRIFSKRELADDSPPLFLGCLHSRPNTRPD